MKSKKNTSNPLLPAYGVFAGSLILSLVLGAWIYRDTKWEVGKCYESDNTYYKVTEIRTNQSELDDKIVSDTRVLMTGVSKQEEEPFYSEDTESTRNTTCLPVVDCSLFHIAEANYNMKKAMANLDKMEKLISEIQRKSK